MPRALVVADLHLGKGFDLYPGRLADQENVWTQALQVGVDNGCDLVLFAGDATERRKPTSEERAAFQRPLAGYPLPVVAIPGNHDVEPGMPTVIDLAGEEIGGGLLIAASRPRVVAVGGVAVCCLPYVHPGRVRAALNGDAPEDADATVTELLHRIAEGLAATARTEHPDLPAVLVTHFATTRWATPIGLPTEGLGEIVLDADLLAGLFDFVAVGHIHKPGLILASVLSPGSPLPLDFSEGGDVHGCWIVDLEPGAVRAEFVRLDYRPFVALDWDAAAVEALLDLPGPPATRGWSSEVEDAIVRLRFDAEHGESLLREFPAITEALMAAGAHRVAQIDARVERAVRARAAHVTGALGPAEALDAWLDLQADIAPDLRFALRARGLELLRRAA